MSDTMELFSARVCPYAHRTRLVLAEKGLNFTLNEIDLSDKPQRFLDVSPYGKVPVLVHGDRALYESSIINQYIDDIAPSPALTPDDPYLRAQMRIWIDYFDNQFLDIYYDALMNRERDKDTDFKEKIEAGLRFIETQGLAKLQGDGPYWLGATPSLIDFAFYPFFERLPVWAHYRNIELPANGSRLKAWIDLMAARPSVTAIANTPEYYIERYKGYAGISDAA